MRHIAVIGSTGSVGTQALDVIASYPEQFSVAALTGHSNVALLAEQARRFHPKVVGISDEALYPALKELLPDVPIVAGEYAHADALTAEGTDTSLISVTGFAGLGPLVKSIESGLHTCVANKESIVCGGEAINDLLDARGMRIYPVDSEHSAIFQCMDGHRQDGIRRILLTCSGGAFRDKTKQQIMDLKADQALLHPNWNMGKKITIDSATLANKGLEVLEARWLFRAPLSGIEVVIHPQSIIHSMVEWEDGSVIAQLGVPDMRLPIQYALSYPKRLPMSVKQLDFYTLGTLSFAKPDLERFPCLGLAYEAGRRGKSAPIAFNAANEIAVQQYLRGTIGFYDIPRLIETAIHAFDDTEPSLSEIPAVDRAVREYIAGSI